MAFGLSGSGSASSMDDADVVVAHYSGNAPKADDYDLNQRSQVSPVSASVGTRFTMNASKHNTRGEKEWLNL